MKFLILFLLSYVQGTTLSKYPSHWAIPAAANAPSAYLLTIPIILITNTYFHLAIGPKMKIQFMSGETNEGIHTAYSCTLHEPVVSRFDGALAPN